MEQKLDETKVEITSQMQQHIVGVLKDSTAQIEHLAADNKYMSARLGVFDSMMSLFRSGGGNDRGMMCSDGSNSPAWRAKQLIAELENPNPKTDEKIIMQRISGLQMELEVIQKRMAGLLEEIKR